MEGVEAALGSLHLTRPLSGACFVGSVPCLGCSSRHTHTRSLEGTIALGAALSGDSPRLCPSWHRGGLPLLSHSPGKGTGMLQLKHMCSDIAVLPLSCSFSCSPEPGAGHGPENPVCPLLQAVTHSCFRGCFWPEDGFTFTSLQFHQLHHTKGGHHCEVWLKAHSM